MGIEYFIFSCFLLLSIWYFPKISFIKNSGLAEKEARIFLVLKMLSGCLFAFYFDKFSTNVDYLVNNAEGKLQYEILISNPSLFFADFIHDMDTYGLGGLLEAKDSFWGYLRFNLLYKFIALLNLLTRGNFYLNSVVFCSIVYFGHMSFYKIFSDIYEGQKLKIIFASFCLPSLLLYTSCIHKDGIIFLSLGIVCYIFYRVLSTPRLFNTKYFLLFFLAMVSIFLFRNYILIAMIPAMMAAILCRVVRFKKRIILLTTYAVFFLLFFGSGLSQSFLNLPAAVVQRKADFSALGKANTNIPMNELYPTAKSFISNLPQAINHYFLRPYPWEYSKPSIILTALELLVYQIIFLAFILYRKKPTTPLHVFNVFGIAFIFNMALIIGYTIPNIGAIVRYRSIFWIFIICPLLCNIDWKRLLSFRKKMGLIDNE